MSTETACRGCGQPIGDWHLPGCKVSQPGTVAEFVTATQLKMTPAQQKEIAYLLEQAAQKARDGVLEWVILDMKFLDGARNTVATAGAPKRSQSLTRYKRKTQ